MQSPDGHCTAVTCNSQGFVRLGPANVPHEPTTVSAMDIERDFWHNAEKQYTYLRRSSPLSKFEWLNTTEVKEATKTAKAYVRSQEHEGKKRARDPPCGELRPTPRVESKQHPAVGTPVQSQDRTRKGRICAVIFQGIDHEPKYNIRYTRGEYEEVTSTILRDYDMIRYLRRRLA